MKVRYTVKIEDDTKVRILLKDVELINEVQEIELDWIELELEDSFDEEDLEEYDGEIYLMVRENFINHHSIFNLVEKEIERVLDGSIDSRVSLISDFLTFDFEIIILEVKDEK